MSSYPAAKNFLLSSCFLWSLYPSGSSTLGFMVVLLFWLTCLLIGHQTDYYSLATSPHPPSSEEFWHLLTFSHQLGMNWSLPIIDVKCNGRYFKLFLLLIESLWGLTWHSTILMLCPVAPLSWLGILLSWFPCLLLWFFVTSWTRAMHASLRLVSVCVERLSSSKPSLS